MKLFRLSTLVLVLSLPVLLEAQSGFVAYQSETLTVDGSVVSFTSAKITSLDPTATANANIATFTVNCASGTACVLRFTIDGSTPTTSHGLRALYGDTVSITGHVNIVAFKSTREISTSVVIDPTYLH